MIEINEKEFFDYIKCPAYYDMKYIKRIPANESSTMQNLLDIVVRFFLANLMNKKVCTMDELKRKWDSVCNDNKDYVNSKRNIEGLNYIINLARWASNNKLTLIDFGSTYEITTDSVILKSSIKPIMAIPGRKCELLDTRFSNKEPDQSELDKKLKYTMDSYAFDTVYGRPLDAIKIVHFKTNKEFTTNRTQNDYNRLLSTIESVGRGIDNKIFYPRESVFCSTCEMKNYCKYWN